MKNLYVDGNSRAIQCSPIGFSKNFSTGVIDDDAVSGYVRIKNVGDGDAKFRYDTQTLADGVTLSAGETEYFYVEPGRHLEVVSGTLNIMY